MTKIAKRLLSYNVISNGVYVDEDQLGVTKNIHV